MERTHSHHDEEACEEATEVEDGGAGALDEVIGVCASAADPVGDWGDHVCSDHKEWVVHLEQGAGEDDEEEAYCQDEGQGNDGLEAGGWHDGGWSDGGNTPGKGRSCGIWRSASHEKMERWYVGMRDSGGRRFGAEPSVVAIVASDWCWRMKKLASCGLAAHSRNRQRHQCRMTPCCGWAPRPE